MRRPSKKLWAISILSLFLLPSTLFTALTAYLNSDAFRVKIENELQSSTKFFFKINHIQKISFFPLKFEIQNLSIAKTKLEPNFLAIPKCTISLKTTSLLSNEIIFQKTQINHAEIDLPRIIDLYNEGLFSFKKSSKSNSPYLQSLLISNSHIMLQGKNSIDTNENDKKNNTLFQNIDKIEFKNHKDQASSTHITIAEFNLNDYSQFLNPKLNPQNNRQGFNIGFIKKLNTHLDLRIATLKIDQNNTKNFHLMTQVTNERITLEKFSLEDSFGHIKASGSYSLSTQPPELKFSSYLEHSQIHRFIDTTEAKSFLSGPIKIDLQILSFKDIHFKLNAGRLDTKLLKEYLRPISFAKSNTNSSNAKSSWNLLANLELQTIKHNKTIINNFKTSLFLKNKMLKANNGEFDIFGGIANFDLLLDLNSNENKSTFNLKIKDLNPKLFTKQYFLFPYISGVARFDTSLNSNGKTMNTLISQLEGKGRLFLDNFHILSLDQKGESLPINKPHSSTDFIINKGILKTESMILDSKGLKGEGNLKINLNTLEHRLKLQATQGIHTNITIESDGSLKNLNPKINGKTIPLSILKTPLQTSQKYLQQLESLFKKKTKVNPNISILKKLGKMIIESGIPSLGAKRSGIKTIQNPNQTSNESLENIDNLLQNQETK